TCVDEPGGSGVASVTPPVTLSSEGAAVTATGTCADSAGNKASATKTVKIDKTAPTIAFSGNAGHYTVDQTVSIDCTASDALSGVATSVCPDVSAPAYALGAGSHTLSASAADRAGNTATGSATF